MVSRAVLTEPQAGPRILEAPARGDIDAGRVGFDWLMVGLSAWMHGGLYLDGWAHIHVPALETFFTPWHAVLYSGYLAGAMTLAWTFYRGRRRGLARARALPPGYGLSLVGACIFLVGGLADLLWHVVFGIENGVEGLISPSHLALAAGGGLMVTGPLRAGLRRGGTIGQGWLSRMPLVLSLTLFLSLITFFTEYVSPYGTTWVAKTPPGRMTFLYQSVGLAGFLVQPAVLMSLILYVLRRQALPRGSLTVVLTVSVALMAVIHDTFLDTGPYPLIGAAVIAGVVADSLLAWLRPSPERPRAFRAIAFAVPALQYLFYFLAVLLWARVTWSVHLWTGAIVIAGGVGWLLSYLIVSPRSPSPSLTGSGAIA